MKDRFKVSYDEVGRMGIDVHELWKIFGIYADIPFGTWWEYMKNYHLVANKDFIGDWITMEAARDICHYEIMRIAEAHNCADPVFFAMTAEIILTASENAEKTALSDEFLLDVKNGMISLMEQKRTT